MMTGAAERDVQDRFALSVIGILALGAILAVNLRFVQEDAFISFRYAENLVRGHGLVWEPGVAVQGYTNFLWTLLVAGGMRLGLEPVIVTYVLGIACFLATLALVMDLVRRITGQPAVALGCGLFLLVNHTFVAYATSGLETMLQTMLLTGAIWQVREIVAGRDFATRRLLALSATFALAGLTRLDSAIFIAGLSLLVLASAWRERARFGRVAVALLAPGAAVLVAYLAFTVSYYGDPLPNTFYAKVGLSRGTAENGVRFVLLFVQQYGFVLPLVPILAQLRALPADKFDLTLLGIVAVWLAYIVGNGGDFMEFRFMVPILPVLTLLLGRAWVLTTEGMAAANRLAVASGGLAALGLLSVYHGWTFYYEQGVEGVPNLRDNLYAEERDLVGIGRELRGIFPESYDGGPSIALAPAGAVPYYSRLRTLDMLGLNDRWVARNGVHVRDRPGHRTMAPLERLIDQRVNLVMGYPVKWPETADPPELCAGHFRLVRDPAAPAATDVLADAPVLALDVNDTFDLGLIYLTSHPSVDRAIAEGDLRVVQDGIGPCT